MRYIAQWDYYSSLCDQHDLGVLRAGAAVDCDPAIAAAINLDSPGVLVEDKPKPPPAVRKAKPAADRQAKPGGTNRKLQ